MKSKMKRRLLAVVLCMVIVLSNSSFIFASGGTDEAVTASQENSQQDVQDTQTETSGTSTETEVSAQSEIATLSETQEAEATPTPEATPEPTPEPTAEPTATPTPEATAEPTATPTPEATTVLEVTGSGETEEQTQNTDAADTDSSQTTVAPTETPAKSNEAVELKQEFKDSDGNVTATVTAQIPEGAFEADASEITMEVTIPEQADAEHVKEMMEENLPENYMLGDYILYDIQFKVNGTVTEAQQPIVITFEGSGLSVKNVERANVFRFDPADPEVDGDEDELIEITQKNEMIEYLQDSGQSTENIDDYDLSEITLKEDGTSDKIQMEGRTSTIYGCYVVYEPVQVLTYENEQVVVTVSAAEEGIIPADAELQVVPITSEDKVTKAQYEEVEKKLQEKAEEEEYEIAGFLAYDISFVDAAGNKTEPSGEVKVSIDYKEAAIPETISEEDAANADVTVLHLEEDEKGEVKEVVDMAQDEKVDVLATTEENKVEKAEVRTDTFSVFALAWEGAKTAYQFSIVDTNSDGLEIALFNYNYGIRQEAYDATDYRFIGKWGVDIQNNAQATDNTGYGNATGLAQGLVKRNLKNEIPEASTDYGNQKGNSLDYLFSMENSDSKTVYENVTGLFQKNDGWYYYDSRTNHAQFNEDSNTLDVYNQALISQYNYGNNKDFQNGNFLPFNTIEDSKYDDYATINVDGKQVDLFNVHETMEDTDLWFGMSISGTFYQPKNGQVDGKDMIFEFSGDDDVWVYIDDVLFLDIGGIHGRISGSINFAEGKVYVDGKEPVTFKELFSQAYEEEHGNLNGFDQYISQILDENGRFKDYTPHKMNFFYLERGGGASNCMLNFNLPIINKNSVSIGKEITDVDTSKYADIEFEYLIEVGEDKESLEPYANKTYKIYDLETRTDTGDIGTTSEEGKFKLKHNQLAVFEEDTEAGSDGIAENLYYQVTELNVNSQEYNEVYVNQIEITSENYNEEVHLDGTIIGNYTNESYDAISPIYQVDETRQVIFRNRCSAYNKRELHISKEMSSGETTATFDMTVSLDGELYSGQYFLIDTNGSRTTQTAANGVITLGVGQEAVIDDIPAGTTFKVVEEELNPADYNAPTYEVTNGGDSPVKTDEASGVTVLGKDTEVVVTNSEYVYVPIPAEEEVPHSKQIDYLGDGVSNPDTNLMGDYYYRLYLSATGIPTEEPDPADILLILDYSSSMRNDYGTGSRMDAVKASARTAINTLLPDGSSNRVGIVWFDKNAADDNINVEFTDNKEILLNNISKRQPDSGTNYQSAFIVAQEMLESYRVEDRNQYVIFVTDGEPYQWVDSDGEIKSTGTNDAKNHAIDQAKEFFGLSGFYAVSVGNDTGMNFLQTVVANVNAGIKDTIEAQDEEELVSTFQQILGSITRQISNVTITDKLSKYVEFVNENGQTITEQQVTETISETNIALKVTKTDKDGSIMTLTAGTDYTYQISGDTISVKFGEDYFLDPGATYTISFNVKLTDEAFTDYVANGGGYGESKGDADTDYGSNTTSSGKDGFYSNDSATFTYTVDENGEPDEKTGFYDDPVVQVSDRMAWQLIKKSDTAGSDIRLEGAEFTLTNGTATYTGVSLSENASTEAVELGYIQWKDSSGVVVQEKDIPAGTYILTETKAPDGYALSTVSWQVTVSNMAEPEICPINSDGAVGTALNGTTVGEGDDTVYQIVITNTPLYDLPSAGGSGIFWYLMGGTLFMIAGSFILYRNKRKEVLGS